MERKMLAEPRGGWRQVPHRGGSVDHRKENNRTITLCSGGDPYLDGVSVSFRRQKHVLMGCPFISIYIYIYSIYQRI